MSEPIFVYNMKDVIGLFFLVGLIIFFLLGFLYYWVKEKIDNWRKR